MKTYRDYQEYLDHQASKLKNNFSEVVQKNHEYQKIVYRRYADFFSWRGQSVICLGARLGGEVEAFKRMGAVAIGIDIEPGIGILEVAVQKAGEYETIDTQDIIFIKQQINRYFKIKFEKPINNGWQGELIILKK